MIRILLPTDFSAPARQALYFAVRTFGLGNVKYILYHISTPPPKKGVMLISIEDILIREARERMDAELNDLKTIFGDSLQVDSFVYLGQISEYIYQVCLNGNMDYVVMGTKGASGLKGKLLGSNASEVMKNSPVPVILVPDEYQNIKDPLKLISVASDLKTSLPVSDIQKFITHAKTDNDLEVEIVHVFKEIIGGQSEIKEQIFNAFPDRNINLVNLENDEVTEGLNDYSERRNPDLVVLLRHHKNLFEKLFTPSISRNVALSTHVPVMIIQEA